MIEWSKVYFICPSFFSRSCSNICGFFSYEKVGNSSLTDLRMVWLFIQWIRNTVLGKRCLFSFWRLIHAHFHENTHFPSRNISARCVLKFMLSVIYICICIEYIRSHSNSQTENWMKKSKLHTRVCICGEGYKWLLIVPFSNSEARYIKRTILTISHHHLR